MALASVAAAQGNGGGNGNGNGGGGGSPDPEPGGGGGGGNPDPGNGGGGGGNPDPGNGGGGGGGGNPDPGNGGGGGGGGNPDPGNGGGGGNGGGSPDPEPPAPDPDPPAPDPDPPAPEPDPPAPDPGNGNGGGNGGGNPDPGNGGGPPADPGPPEANANAQGGNANAGGANAGGGNNANAHGANANAGGAVAGGNSADAGPPEGVGNPNAPGLARANETRGNSNESRGRSNESHGNASASRGNDRNDTGRPDEPGSRGKGGSGGSLGNGGGPGSAAEGRGPDALPAVALERASVPEENTRAASVVVRAENRTLNVAQGNVEVASVGVADEESAFVVLIHPNGTEEVLATGASNADWNTTAYENGYYMVEVRERSSSGEVVTVASTRVLVENPRAEIVAAVAAVATGAAISAGAGMLAARSFDIFALLKSAGAAAGEAGGDLAGEAVEDKLRTRTAAVAAVDWRYRSALLLLLAGAMLAFFKVFADRDSILLALPFAFLAAFVYTVGDYSAEWALARASGAQTRFRIWTPGAISLALSSIIFRSPFGYPGYVSETDVTTDGDRVGVRRRAGLRALAFMGAGIGLTLPFLLVGSIWRWDLAEFGVGIALMMTAAGSMPFSPMPGKDVWAWSKPAWATVFAALVVLYVTWQIAILPMWLLIGLALAGAAGFVVALRWLSRIGREA